MNKAEVPIESALSPGELTAYFENIALRAVQQHVKELNGFIVVDGYLEAIPDAASYGWHYAAVLADSTAAGKATVLVDIRPAVLSRADVRVGDHVRVRGLLITDLFRNSLSFRIQARSIEAVDAPEEIRKLREERANISHLKTLIGRRKPFPFKALIKISLIFSRAGTARVKEDFLGELASLSEQIEIEELPVSMSSSTDLVNAVNAASGDILVFARGGGEVDQFAVFDDPVLLEHVASKDAYRITGLGHSANRTLLDLVVDFSASVPATAGTHIARQLNLYMTVQKENAKLSSGLSDLSRKHAEVVASASLLQRRSEDDLKTTEANATRKRYRWSIAAFLAGAIVTLCITWFLKG